MRKFKNACKILGARSERKKPCGSLMHIYIRLILKQVLQKECGNEITWFRVGTSDMLL
jgi:hypothetical protein